MIRSKDIFMDIRESEIIDTIQCETPEIYQYDEDKYIKILQSKAMSMKNICDVVDYILEYEDIFENQNKIIKVLKDNYPTINNLFDRGHRWMDAGIGRPSIDSEWF